MENVLTQPIPLQTVKAKTRLASLDIARGLVMVLMTIDHVRHLFAVMPFEPEDIAQTTPALFFTRWITHFCAPAFVLLAGTSAFLYGRKAGSRRALSRFLLTRGLWLIFAEVVVINLSLTFALPHQTGFIFLQVIWAIGLSMIALAGLIWLPRRGIGLVAAMLIFGHNLLDSLTAASFGPLGWLWNFLHVGMSFVPVTAGFGMLIIYPILPWLGVMAAGYLLGPVLKLPRRKRHGMLFSLGTVAILLFITLRLLDGYGDPSPWAVQERGLLYTFLDFLNTTKYPPSLLYLAMTLGPVLVLLPLLERVRGWLTDVLQVFGRVPFFFYILHFALLNALSVIWHYALYSEFFIMFTTPYEQLPENYRASLGLVYFITLPFLTGMYFLCRAFGRYKQMHRQWWLSYL